MKSYAITQCSNVLNWQVIPRINVNCKLWGTEADVAMTQQMVYDENALYIRQEAWETDIRMVHHDPLSHVWEDSCMEFFFAFEKANRYFNMEINPNGCLHFAFGKDRQSRMQIVFKNSHELFDIRPEFFTDGWILTYQIPITVLHNFYPELTLKPGLAFYGNCYKCGDKTRTPHFLSWNPITVDKPNFHRVCDFGEFQLI